MRNRVCQSPRLLVALVALSAWWATPVAAQPAMLSITPATAPVAPTNELIEIHAESNSGLAIDALVEAGLHLEQQRRWSEALSHYEKALRKHVGNRSLERRQDLTKLHYSLETRYNDRSYVQSTRSLSMAQAQDLYLELLRKIDKFYVSNPPWQQLGVRGITAVDMALTDQAFGQAHGLRINETQIQGLRLELLELVGSHPITRLQDLSSLAVETARLLESRLGVRSTATVLEFVTAAAGGLDDYSAYLTADQLRDVYSQIEGNFVGLGVELKADNGALLIVHVIPGSPAEKAGILDGDRIIEVDGLATSSMSTDEAASMLTGAAGTEVRLAAVTSGEQPRRLTVKRAHVDVPSMEGVRIIDQDYGVAYVRIPAFQKTTAKDLDKALWKLHSQGMRSLVLDLRGNPGGLLTASVEAADKFLQKGGIVSTEGRSPQENYRYQAHYGGTWRVPLVVLIDGDSASASEIFAGAIKDNQRGLIVGEKSYGKGSVQGIFPLGYAGSGIRLTTALFKSPNGQKISKNGVDPNLSPTVVAKPINGQVGTEDDPILAAGVEAAVQAMQRRTAARQ